MALKATVFKVQLTVADSNRAYYQDHSLTLAQHPSETDSRLLLRLVIFALNAHEYLQFTRGLSSTDEPDLWQKSLTGDIEHWIDMGQPTDKRIRQSSGKADRVSLYPYQRSSALLWYESMKADLERFKNLRVILLQATDERAGSASGFIDRSMDLCCVISDQDVILSKGEQSMTFQTTVLKDWSRLR
jgi:uncharacterized protein YaeQ